MATQQTKRGFPRARCLWCSEDDSVVMNLADVTAFRCQECEAEWTVEDVAQIVSDWQRVLAWVDQAPVIE